MIGRQAVWKEAVPRANPAARGQIYTPKRARAVTVRRRRGPVLVQIVVMGGDIGPAAEPVNPGTIEPQMQKGRPDGRPSALITKIRPSRSDPRRPGSGDTPRRLSRRGRCTVRDVIADNRQLLGGCRVVNLVPRRLGDVAVIVEQRVSQRTQFAVMSELFDLFPALVKSIRVANHRRTAKLRPPTMANQPVCKQRLRQRSHGRKQSCVV